jgi:transcriptional regulator of arginine metabolism
MHMKGLRHQKIRSLLRSNDVGSQESLQRLLADDGIEVNQATLSRDLRALGVVKQAVNGGGFRYAQPSQPPLETIAFTNLAAFVHDVLCSGNLMVIKTRVGGAQPVALAVDQLGVDGVIGTIAGDDTVLAVLAENVSATDAITALWNLIEKGQRT